MKTRLLIFLFFLGSPSIYSQATWNWSLGEGSSSQDNCNGAATYNGNVFITGSYYNDTLNLGSFQFPNWGSGDLYIAGYDAGGTALWAITAGSSNLDQGYDIAVDSAGNIYVTGYFASDAITLGGTLLLNTDPVNGTHDIFLAKLDASGNVLWAIAEGGLDSDYGAGVACDGAGNVYITGSFASTTMDLSGITLTNSSTSNFFIAKYDPLGNIIYAHNNSQGYASGISLGCDIAGNAYALGSLADLSLTLGSQTLTNMDGLGFTPDLFMVKYDVNGIVEWAQVIGGPDSDENGSLAVDIAGNLFITGFYFSDSINIGGVVLQNGSVGGDDLFTAKFDATGTIVWVREGDGYCQPYTVATDAQGSCYIAGGFSDYITFGGDTLFEFISGVYRSDVVVVKYDAAGNLIWQERAGGYHYDDCWALAPANDGSLFIAGDFSSDTSLFGSTVLINTSAAGIPDIFLSRLYGGCAAGFYLFPDTTIPHHYIAINTSTGTAPISYTWYWGDGSTDTIPYPSHVYADSGFYDICLEITDASACTSMYCDSSFHALHSLNPMVYISVHPTFPTGIPAPDSETEPISIFPNPAGDRMYISGTDFTEGEHVRLIITNLLGEIVQVENVTWNSMSGFSLRNLTGGIYVLRLAGSRKVATARLIKAN